MFLPTNESFAHEYHKQRVLDAKAGDTLYTDLFAINWPPHAPVRVLPNSLTHEVGDRLLGHHPHVLPREVIAHEPDYPIYKFSTNSPLRTTTGDLEKMALYAGESAALVNTRSSAAEVIDRLVQEAIDAVALVNRASG